jgi:quercetin dioxygenase-like cupin family protein
MRSGMKPRRLWFVFLLLVIGPRNEHTVRAQGPKAEPGGVSYWKGSEAFAKGSLLLDRRDTSNYQVYAVRRDKPGTVEQHALDTDIIMVLEGAATFVTGGSVTDARTLGPNEASGSGIRDGQSRQLGKGDVVIVPNGTPHWFRDVSPTISYFAVKLRQTNIQTQAPSNVIHCCPNWTGPTPDL